MLKVESLISKAIADSLLLTSLSSLRALRLWAIVSSKRALASQLSMDLSSLMVSQ